MAAAIDPSMDREYLEGDGDPPARDDPGELAERGELLVRSAEAWHAAGKDAEAREALDALQALPGAADAKRLGRELEESWK